MGETLMKCKCPSCKKYIKGKKYFGLYSATLNGRGMKAINSLGVSTADGDQTDDEDE